MQRAEFTVLNPVSLRINKTKIFNSLQIDNINLLATINSDRYFLVTNISIYFYLEKITIKTVCDRVISSALPPCLQRHEVCSQPTQRDVPSTVSRCFQAIFNASRSPRAQLIIRSPFDPFVSYEDAFILDLITKL